MIELNFASVKLRQRQQWERDLISTELRWKFDNECDSKEHSPASKGAFSCFTRAFICLFELLSEVFNKGAMSRWPVEPVKGRTLYTLAFYHQIPHLNFVGDWLSES